MKVDMSPSAVTRRLETLSARSRAGILLGKIGRAKNLRAPLSPAERAIIERCASRAAQSGGAPPRTDHRD